MHNVENRTQYKIIIEHITTYGVENLPDIIYKYQKRFQKNNLVAHPPEAPSHEKGCHYNRNLFCVKLLINYSFIRLSDLIIH